MARDLARVRIRAEDESRGAFDSFKRNIADSVTGINGLGAGVGRLTGFLSALGFTVSVGGLGLLASQAIGAHAALDDLSEMTSLTVEMMSSLDRVAQIGGHSLDGVGTVAQRFARSVGDAAGGNKELVASFAALGISQERLRTARFDDLFVEFADKISRAENKTYAITHAMDLAGRSAAQALPFFSDLAAEGLKQARVTTDQAAAAEELGKQWRRLTYDASLFKDELATGLVPVLSNLLAQVKAAKEVGGSPWGAFQLFMGNSGSDPLAELREVTKELAEAKAARDRLMQPTAVNHIREALGSNGLAEASEIVETLEKRRQFLMRVASGASVERDNFDRMGGGGFDLGAPAQTSTAKAAESPYGNLFKGLETQERDLARKVALMEEMSALDKFMLELDTMKPELYARITQAELLELEAKAHGISLMQQELREREYQKDMDRVVLAGVQEETRAREERDAVISSFNAHNVQTRQSLAFETELLDLQRSSLAGIFTSTEDLRKLQLDYEVQRETSIALRKLEIDFTKRIAGATEEQYDALKKLYDLERNRLPEEIRRNREAQFAIDTISQARTEAVRASDDINRAMTDALFRAFEDGKGFGESFFDTLKNAAKSTVLRPVVQFLVQPIGNAVSLALGSAGIPGLGAGAAGGGGIGNLLSGASSINNLLGGGGLGGAIFGSAGAYAAAVPGLTSAAVGSQAALLAAQTGVFGSAGLGATAAAGGAGALGAGISALGTALPYIGAAVAIGGALGLFGGSKSPAVGTGYQFLGNYSPSAGFSDFQARGHFKAGDRAGYDLMRTDGHAAILAPMLTTAFTEFTQLAKSLGYDASSIASRSVPFNVSTAGIGQAHDDASKPEVVKQIVGQWAEELIPGLREMAHANEDLADTFLRLASAQRQADLNGIFAKMQGVIGVADELSDLWLTDLSPLTARQRLDRSQSEYAKTLAGARGGDLQAIADLSGISRGYIREAKSYYGGTASAEFGAIFGGVQTSIQDLVSDTLTEQSIKFSEMGLTLKDIDGKLGDLDTRIAAALAPALEAMRVAQEAMAAAQKAAADRIVQAQADAARESALAQASADSARMAPRAFEGLSYYEENGG